MTVRQEIVDQMAKNLRAEREARGAKARAEKSLAESGSGRKGQAGGRTGWQTEPNGAGSSVMPQPVQTGSDFLMPGSDPRQKMQDSQAPGFVPFTPRAQLPTVPMVTDYQPEALQLGITSAMRTQAEKNYTDYQKLKEQERGKNMRSAMLYAARNGTEMPGIAYGAALQNQGLEVDEEEKRLKALVDYWTGEEQNQKIQAVHERNLDAFSRWPAEDKEMMETFNANRIGRLSWLSAAGDSTGSAASMDNAKLLAASITAQKALEAKYGKKRVQEIAETLSWVRNEEQTEKMRQDAQQMADNHPVIASALARGANVAGSLTSPFGQMQNLIIRPTGQYPTLDPNNLGNLPNVTAGEITQTVAQNIRGENPTAWSEAGAALYQAGMSAADSLVRAYLGGGSKIISNALIASGSFGSAMAEYSAQGASPEKALLMSLVDASLEVLTEQIPLDTILKQAEIAPGSVKEFLEGIAKSAGEEITEETVNFIASAAAQQVILGSQSEKNQMIAELVANGVPYAKALDQAQKKQLMDIAATMIESGLSGGMMAAGSQTVGSLRAKNTGRALGRLDNNQDMSLWMIHQGLKQDPGSAEYQVAKEMQGKLEQGQRLSTYEQGRLYQANGHLLEGFQRGWGGKPADYQETEGQAKADAAPMEQAQNTETAEGQKNETAAGQRSQPEQDTLRQQSKTLRTDLGEVDIETLPIAVRKSLERMSKATGRKVHCYTAAAGEHAVENGFELNGEIWVNTERKNSHVAVFAHELTHTIEGAPQYDEILPWVMRRIAQRTDLDKKRETIRSLYNSMGVEVSKAEIDREIVADYVASDLLTNEQSVLQLAQENRGVVRRLLNGIDRILAKLGNEKAQERVFLRDVRAIYAQALRETSGQNRSSNSSVQAGNRQAAQQTTVQEYDWDGDVSDVAGYRAMIEAQYAAGEMTEEEYRENMDWADQQEAENAQAAEGQGDGRKYSFAGVNARNADMEALEQARKMEEAEVAEEVIRQQTGWFRGMDGKWRFEVDDSGSQVKKHQGKMTLDQLLEHDELFEHYPDMRKMPVEFADLPEGTNAQYSRELDAIRINRNLADNPEKIRSAVLHEIQHGIQKREGFAKGATLEYWEGVQGNPDRAIGELDGKLKKAQAYAQDILNGLPKDAAEQFRAWYDLYQRDEAAGLKQAQALADGEYGKQFREYLNTVWNIDSLQKYNRLRGAMDLYRNTAGEIEARDAADRAGLDAEGRKKTPPNLGDERTVFAEGSEKKYSISPTTDGRMVAVIDDDILAGIDTTVWDSETQKKVRKAAADALMQFKDGIVVDGITRKFNRDSRREFTKSGDSKRLESRNKEVFIDKMRAADVADDIVIATTGWRRDGGLKHPRTDKFVDFEHGDVLIESAKRQYEARVVVGITDTGEMVFYDVVDMNPTSFQKKEEPPTTATTHDAIGDIYGDSSDERIAQKADDVKKNFSISPVQKVEEQTDGGEKSARERLDRKSQDALKKAERQLMNSIAKKMGVPYVAKRENLMPIIQKITDAYLENGRIDPKLEEQLFEESWAAGRTIEREFYDQYKDVKDWIRTVGLTISREDAANIPDWAEWKKRAFGTVRIVKDGTPVDTAWQELRSMAPELFPERITHPADQLQRIYDVAQGIQIVEKSLEDTYGEKAEDAKRWYRNDFSNSIMDVQKQLTDVRRYAAQKAAVEKKETVYPKTVAEAIQTGEDMKKARREYERVRAKELIGPQDEDVLRMLMRGEMTIESLENPVYDGMNRDAIRNVYAVKKKYEDLHKQMVEYKKQAVSKRRETAGRLLGNSLNWKDKAAGLLYSRETMRRNILDIVTDRETADEINRIYFDPVQVHEAERTRFLNEMRDRVRAMNINQEVVQGDEISESAATQIIGEAMDHIEQLSKVKSDRAKKYGLNAKEWQGIINDVLEKNPSLDPMKLQRNIYGLRAIYEELLPKMNEVQVACGYEPISHRSGYFSHFNAEQGGDGLLAKLGRDLGLNTSAEMLPTSINGMTAMFKPGKQWFGNSLERKGNKTTYDAVMGFDRYIEGASNIIYHTEDIQNLRALESEIRYRSTDDGVRQQVDEVMADNRLTMEEKNDKIQRIYEHAPFTLSNFVDELMEYTNLLAGKKSRLDRTVEKLMGRKFYTVMKNVEARVGANMIAGNIGSALTNFIPLQQAAVRMDRGVLLEGMWSTLKAMKDDDGFADMSDFLTNRRGSDRLVSSKMERISKALGTPMEIIDNFVSESIVRAQYAQNQRAGLSGDEALHQADIFAAGVMGDRSKGAMPTLFESRNPLIKGLTQFQLEVNNQFSEVLKDLPREVGAAGAGALAALLLKYFLCAYLFNDAYEFFTGRRPAMDPFGILNDTVGDFSGYQMPNLLEAGEEVLTGEGVDFTTKKEENGKALKNLGSNVAGQLPFSSVFTGGRIPVGSAIPDLGQLTKLADEDIAPRKKADIAITEASKLGYIAAPFGYGQAQKTWKGIKALLEGGSYTMNNQGEKQLQYPIFKEDMGAGTVLKAGLLGKSGLSQAKAWADGGYNRLSAEQSALYQDLIDAGTEDKVAYETILKVADAMKKKKEDLPEGTSRTQNMLEVLLGQDLSPKARAMAYERNISKDSGTGKFMAENRGNDEVYTMAPEIDQAQKAGDETTTQAKIRVIQDAKISDAAKSALYYGMVADDKTRELMDAMTDQGADGAQVAQTLMAMQQTEGLKGAEKTIAKRNAIADSGLEDEFKHQLYREKVSDSKESEIAEFRAANMDIDTFLKVQNEYSRINAQEGKKASQKAQDFSHWLEKQGLTKRQKDVARDCFTYYSMVPANAKWFNSAVDAGCDPDITYEVINKISGLQPKAGHKSVSDGQKLQVIVESGLPEKQQMELIQHISVTDKMKKRLPILVDYGVSIKKQAAFWDKIYEFDLDGNGKINQKEVRACLDSFPGGNINPLEVLLGITSSTGSAWTAAEKAAMWQSYSTQFSAKKNPYDREVGQRVKDTIKGTGKKQAQSTGRSETKPKLTTGNPEVDKIMGW